MKTLYLVRHGQTQMNERNLKQGRWDSPLTELGRNQARQAGEYLEARGIAFDHAYSSPAGRACDTLELIRDMDYRRLPGLNELSFGVYEGQPCFLGAQHKPYGDYYIAFGGEGEKEVGQRMLTTIRELMEKEDHQNVLIVSHGAAIVNFIKEFYDLQSEPGVFPVGNCTITQIEYDEDTGRFHFKGMTDAAAQALFLQENA